MAEEIYKGGPLYKHAEGVFKPGADSMLPAGFVRTGRLRRFCDAGCGGGIITLMLLARVPEAEAVSIDISEDAAALCRENLALNGMSGKVVCGDLREYRALFEAGSFDLVVSNPPYFVPGRGKAPQEAFENAARAEAFLSLRELCEAAAYMLKNRGKLCLVYRPERLSELFCAMSACGIEPKRLQLCAASYEAAPSLVLVEGVRGAAPGLTMEKPLLIK